jgi:hypothetical protein
MGELPNEARLADAGLADDRHHLAMRRASQLQGLTEPLELRVAPDEASEATGRIGLEPRAHRSGADDLEDLDRSVQALDRALAQGLHHDVAFR